MRSSGFLGPTDTSSPVCLSATRSEGAVDSWGPHDTDPQIGGGEAYTAESILSCPARPEVEASVCVTLLHQKSTTEASISEASLGPQVASIIDSSRLPPGPEQIHMALGSITTDLPPCVSTCPQGH